MGTSLRVATLGASVLTAGVRALPAGGVLQPLGPHGPRHVDVLLLGSDASDASALADQAAEAGIPVVRHPAAATPSDAADAGADEKRMAAAAPATVTVGPTAGGGPWPRPTIDTNVLNPIGVRWAAPGPFAVAGIAPGAQWARGVAEIRATTGETALAAIVRERAPSAVASVRASGAMRLVRVGDDPAEVVAALRSYAGVVDHPDLHDGPAQRAEWLALLACAGVPIVALGLDDEVAGRLGPGLVDALTSTSLDALRSAAGRDHVSVRQRRAALREHSAETAWRTIAAHFDLTPAPVPSVSVVLATNRPERVLSAVSRSAAFRYASRELIVALHGDGFDDGTEAAVTEAAGSAVTVRHIPAARTLGEVLNAAVEAASGDLVTKLDDDDLYDVDHLDDLVEALRYSGATMVGKGSEFVHLGEINLTIRRLPKGAESSSRTIAGGTLMIGRDDLRRLGGWQRAPRSVDQLLMDDVLAAGGRIHRTHGHGFVLNRHGRGHTWDTPTDYFLRQAVQQWPGVALEAAGFTTANPGASR